MAASASGVNEFSQRGLDGAGAEHARARAGDRDADPCAAFATKHADQRVARRRAT